MTSADQFVNLSKQVDEMWREYEQRTSVLNQNVESKARHFGDSTLGTFLSLDLQR